MFCDVASPRDLSQLWSSGFVKVEQFAEPVGSGRYHCRDRESGFASLRTVESRIRGPHRYMQGSTRTNQAGPSCTKGIR